MGLANALLGYSCVKSATEGKIPNAEWLQHHEPGEEADQALKDALSIQAGCARQMHAGIFGTPAVFFASVYGMVMVRRRRRTTAEHGSTSSH